MSKFTCLVLCVVASLSSVHVTRADKPNLRNAWRSELDECAKEYPVTNDEIDKAVTSADSSNIHPCFNFCVFNKTGFFTEKGEYDLRNGLTKLRKAIKDDEEYSKFEEVATECTKVKNTASDEKAKCDSGNRLSLCFLRYKDKSQNRRKKPLNFFFGGKNYTFFCIITFNLISADPDLDSFKKNEETAADQD